MSYKEVSSVLNLMNISYELEGTGYVYEQSVKVGEKISDKIVLKLKEKY